MSGFKNGLEYHTQSLKSDQDEKLEIASRASKTGAEYSDDPTRSTLHTGEFASGKLEDRGRMEGAPSEPSLNSTGDQPQNTVETTTDQTAPLVGRSFASGQSPAFARVPVIIGLSTKFAGAFGIRTSPIHRAYPTYYILRGLLFGFSTRTKNTARRYQSASSCIAANSPRVTGFKGGLILK